MKKITILLSFFIIGICSWLFHAFAFSDSALAEIALNRLNTELKNNTCTKLVDYQHIKSDEYIVVTYSWLCINSSQSYYYSVDVLGNGSTELHRLSLDDGEKNEMLNSLKSQKVSNSD